MRHFGINQSNGRQSMRAKNVAACISLVIVALMSGFTTAVAQAPQDWDTIPWSRFDGRRRRRKPSG